MASKRSESPFEAYPALRAGQRLSRTDLRRRARQNPVSGQGRDRQTIRSSERPAGPNIMRPFQKLPDAAAPALERQLAIPRLSLVVLPFANIGGDPEQDYFAGAHQASRSNCGSVPRGPSPIVSTCSTSARARLGHCWLACLQAPATNALPESASRETKTCALRLSAERTYNQRLRPPTGGHRPNSQAPSRQAQARPEKNNNSQTGRGRSRPGAGLARRGELPP